MPFIGFGRGTQSVCFIPPRQTGPDAPNRAAGPRRHGRIAAGTGKAFLRYHGGMIESPPSARPARALALLFTGHMIDAPGRTPPRFPPAMERVAAKVIRDEVAAAAERASHSLIGIASGARGGDILFHEACLALGVPTMLVLPFAVEPFLARSVRGVPEGEWEARFKALWTRLPACQRVVLDGENDSDPFGACNRAMLAMARNLGETVRLLALWDGADAKKPGGTGAFVAEARAGGGIARQIDTRPMLAAVGSRR